MQPSIDHGTANRQSPVAKGDSVRRAAIYVDKILKVVSRANCPSSNRPKFELVSNLKTAKQIGLTIPHRLLATADRVIRCEL